MITESGKIQELNRDDSVTEEEEEEDEETTEEQSTAPNVSLVDVSMLYVENLESP